MSETNIEFKKGSIICRQDEKTDKLYYVNKGELLVFGIDGTKVTPLAEIESGEFVGELAFFDGDKRSAFVLASTDSELVEISEVDKTEDMPSWMLHFVRNLTKRLRSLDEVIMQKGLKRKKDPTLKALSIDEQREILAAVEA